MRIPKPSLAAVVGLVVEDAQGLAAVTGGGGVVALPAEEVGEAVGDDRVVVHDEDAGLVGHGYSLGVAWDHFFAGPGVTGARLEAG